MPKADCTIQVVVEYDDAVFSDPEELYLNLDYTVVLNTKGARVLYSCIDDMIKQEEQ